MLEKKTLGLKNLNEKILSCAQKLEIWAPFPPPYLEGWIKTGEPSKERGGGWGAVISSGSLLSFVSKGGPLKNWRQQAQYDLYKRPVTLVKLKTKDKNQISLVAESKIDFVMQQLFCWLYYLWFSAISGFLTCSWTTIGALWSSERLWIAIGNSPLGNVVTYWLDPAIWACQGRSLGRWEQALKKAFSCTTKLFFICVFSA